MRRKELKKRSGGTRVVFCPSAHERKVLRAELKTLQSHNSTTLPYAHGFMVERSPLTAAKQHVGFEVTINLDLKDFFPSVTPAMVKGLVPKTLSPICWAGDGCGQGLPTAPALANLAAKSMDEAVVKYCKKQQKAGAMERFAYTRYADDLSLSLSPDPGQEKIVAIKAMLTEIVRRCGFMPNPRKWRVQRARGGRREIVGLLVGETDNPIRPTRKWRHRHRALQHKLSTLASRSRDRNALTALRKVVTGQRQWLEPKQPLTAEEKTARSLLMADVGQLAEANKFCEKIGIPALTSMRKAIPAVTVNLPGGLLGRITNDPVYYIGVSDFVTRAQRSASCLRTGLVWNTGLGQYGGTGAWWWKLRGCSIAHIVNPRNLVEGLGVSRPAQLARVLVFKMTDDSMYYQSRIYAESDAARIALKNFLTAQGIPDVRTIPNSCAVVGSVQYTGQKCLPYLDNGSFNTNVRTGQRHDSIVF